MYNKNLALKLMSDYDGNAVVFNFSSKHCLVICTCAINICKMFYELQIVRLNSCFNVDEHTQRPDVDILSSSTLAVEWR